MQITKNDLYGFIKRVDPSENSPRHKTTISAVGSTEEQNPTSFSRLNIDHLRQKVLSLQADVNEMQTHLTKNQQLLAGLENFKNDDSWSHILEGHIQEAFQNPEFKITEKNPLKLAQQLNNENNYLIEKLKNKEVQLENIFSTGIIGSSENRLGQMALENTDQVKIVFGKLSNQKIADLLKN